jgi:hypothetical protein
MLDLRRPSLVIATSLLLFGWIPARAQIKDQKIFETIPAAQRSSFIARLSLYIDYSLSGQQSRLETLYSEDELCSLCKGKRECIDNCSPAMTAEVPEGYTALLIALQPRQIERYTAAPYWHYSIDADQVERVSWKGKPARDVKSKVRLFAVFERGDWYFSLISIPAMIWL